MMIWSLLSAVSDQMPYGRWAERSAEMVFSTGRTNTAVRMTMTRYAPSPGAFAHQVDDESQQACESDGSRQKTVKRYHAGPVAIAGPSGNPHSDQEPS